MKLKIFPFENCLDFSNNCVNILEIHNTKLFFNIVMSFLMYCDNQPAKETIYLYDESEELDIHKHCYFVENIFSIEINDKKIINKLYSKLENDILLNDEIAFNIGKQYQEFFQYFIEIFNNYDLDFDYNIDFSIKNFLKMIQLNFINEKQDLITNLYTFVDIICEFNLYNILILNNIKAYINDDELIEFYKYCCYKKINILLLEPLSNRPLLNYERKMIIDYNYDDFIQIL